MSKCLFLIGNSSSGVREGSFIGCRTINVGSRQNNRDIGSNLIQVDDPLTVKKLKNSFNKLIEKKNIIKEDIYGKGNSAKKIVSEILKNNTNIQKKWNKN